MDKVICDNHLDKIPATHKIYLRDSQLIKYVCDKCYKDLEDYEFRHSEYLVMCPCCDCEFGAG